MSPATYPFSIAKTILDELFAKSLIERRNGSAEEASSGSATLYLLSRRLPDRAIRGF